MIFLVLVIACLGFLSPANRGALGTTAVTLFVLLGTPAGYTSARLYKTFGGERWKSYGLKKKTKIGTVTTFVFF